MFITNPKELPKLPLPELPEVYQIEVTSICNYSCIMCPTPFFSRKDKVPFIDIDLVKKIVGQGDLDASYIVEFQMAGEPLLHPKLSEIIDTVKSTGVKTGLSTNGSMIKEQMEALKKLDFITVSVDSLTDHDAIRINSENKSCASRIADIRELLIVAEHEGITVDLQVIELTGWEYQMDILQDLFGHYSSVKIRSIINCMTPYFFPEDYILPVSTELCMNPWLSASIQTNGNVTSCCFSQGDDTIYGNLKDSTLRSIWNNSEVLKLRQEHQDKNYRPICGKCFARSPVLFHQNLFYNSLRELK